MKTLSVLILLVILLSACSGGSIPSGTDLSHDGTGTEQAQDAFSPSSPAKDEFFINADEGWKAEYEYIGMFKENMVLYKTNDGGKTWTEVANTDDSGSSLPWGAKTGMSFIDSDRGWITTDTPRDGKVELYKTQDGGKTWSEQELDIPKEFQECDIHSFPPLFFSLSDGIMPAFASKDGGGQDSLLFVTHDSGETWTLFVNESKGESDGIEWNFHDWKYEVTAGDQSWIFEHYAWKRIE